ncbi:hypothetical protein [Clostridium cellulovorans]|uniref:Uncharacterized protein n=1 Tax=Clostridium cellulovorans (strain ATCC 35296 / DSM 3052 / OCM 3 / 743B) TaxID=573061 RepID=D9SSX4_CLOC7|nr:hypothetical protein [Clostridium cellulovorans]ADL52636.1 hypothetical protein Clocel_2943 [Clostridium cellulovorans 743B]
MREENDKKVFSDEGKIGNFTRWAVENFEENIVEQKDYLEKVKKRQNNKFSK